MFEQTAALHQAKSFQWVFAFLRALDTLFAFVWLMAALSGKKKGALNLFYGHVEQPDE